MFIYAFFRALTRRGRSIPAGAAAGVGAVILAAPVQRLLQHSSAATTQRYIGIEPQRIEAAIEEHAALL